jgi:hypothetical protein
VSDSTMLGFSFLTSKAGCPYLIELLVVECSMSDAIQDWPRDLAQGKWSENSRQRQGSGATENIPKNWLYNSHHKSK